MSHKSIPPIRWNVPLINATGRNVLLGCTELFESVALGFIASVAFATSGSWTDGGGGAIVGAGVASRDTGRTVTGSIGAGVVLGTTGFASGGVLNADEGYTITCSASSSSIHKARPTYL
jgi:hypothetical protein